MNSAAGIFLRNFTGALVLTLLLVSAGAWLAARPIVGTPAERLRTAAFEFELPAGWVCQREETEHVCKKGAPPHAAIVIMTMKERGPTDTLAKYRQHLSAPQAASDPSGRTWTSEVLEVGEQRLGGHDWVIGRHLGSEIRNYHTDYYAALTSHKAILLTFSAHTSAREQAAKEFARMLQTLKVFQD